MSELSRSKREKKPLGIFNLTFLMVGSMIGSGIFALPQNLASGAAMGAVLIGWIVTAIGITALSMVFGKLALARPDLANGVYSYPKTGFGSFIGFNSAWGYWLSGWIGNVSFCILLLSALGYFFPIFGDGTTPYAILGASIILWALHFMILRGIREAFVINLIVTLCKLVPIVLFILLVFTSFRVHIFSLDFWGKNNGSVLQQMKSTMLVTLWLFIGIEAASVQSSRAHSQHAVKKATMLALVVTLLLYILITILSFGTLSHSTLATAHNPSMAVVLSKAVGPAGAVIVNVGVIISLLGALLSWILLAVQLPFDCAKEGDMPAVLAKVNKNDSPTAALWLTNGLVQLFLILTLFYHGGYLIMLKLATSCILVPYLLCSLFGLLHLQKGRICAFLALVYSLWLVYSAGLNYLLLSTILYAIGLIAYIWSRKQNNRKLFTKTEGVIAILLLLLAIWAIVLLLTG